MRYIFKKSTNLTEVEKEQLIQLFYKIFNKKKSINQFENKFFNNVKGYSYHGLLLAEDIIVGSYNAIPFKYKYFNTNLIFALSVDTMIHPDYRKDPFIMERLSKLTYNKMKQDGISFIFGFPNDNFYNYEKLIIGTKDIGRLNFYMLPINLGKILKIDIRILNVLTKILSYFLNLIRHFCFKIKDINYNITKENDAIYCKYRYNLTDRNYNIIGTENKGFFSYKIDDFDGIQCAYIIDVFPLNKYNFVNAVNTVYKRERKKVDIVLYVGNLPFCPINMLKVPKKYEPKNINMTGKIISKAIDDEKIFNLNNWAVNLSNFDVI